MQAAGRCFEAVEHLSRPSEVAVAIQQASSFNAARFVYQIWSGPEASASGRQHPQRRRANARINDPMPLPAVAGSGVFRQLLFVWIDALHLPDCSDQTGAWLRRPSGTAAAANGLGMGPRRSPEARRGECGGDLAPPASEREEKERSSGFVIRTSSATDPATNLPPVYPTMSRFRLIPPPHGPAEIALQHLDDGLHPAIAIPPASPT